MDNVTLAEGVKMASQDPKNDQKWPKMTKKPHFKNARFVTKVSYLQKYLSDIVFEGFAQKMH